MKVVPIVLIATLMLAACSQPDTVSGETAPASPTSFPVTTSSANSPTTHSDAARVVMVFSATAGYRHDSIEAGIEAVEEIGAGLGFTVESTEDSAVLVERLGATDVVVFLNTTGDILNDEQQVAFESWLENGGGFVGIHSATDTEYDWAWYGGLVGTYFSQHPAVQEATVELMQAHPVTAGLPDSFRLEDEWYDFRDRPGDSIMVIAEVDESTYEGGDMGDPHPIAWAHEYRGGRSVYLGFGHPAGTFSDSNVRTLIENAMSWVSEG